MVNLQWNNLMVITESDSVCQSTYISVPSWSNNIYFHPDDFVIAVMNTKKGKRASFLFNVTNTAEFLPI